MNEEELQRYRELVAKIPPEEFEETWKCPICGGITHEIEAEIQKHIHGHYEAIKAPEGIDPDQWREHVEQVFDRRLLEGDNDVKDVNFENEPHTRSKYGRTPDGQPYPLDQERERPEEE